MTRGATPSGQVDQRGDEPLEGVHGTAFCDGSGNSPRGSSCACVVLDSVSGEVLAEVGTVIDKCSNNVAEYHGLHLALMTAAEIGITHLEVFSDSQLIVNQVNEKWDVKDPNLSLCRDI